MGVDTRQALPLHDETRRRGRVTRANLKDATVHQDPKRWAFGRRYAASPSSVCVMRLLPTVRIQPYTRVLNVGLVDVVQKRVPDFCFVCVTRLVPTVGMQTVHQDPKRWAYGRRSTASPSSASTVRLCQLQGCDCTPGSQALGLWASFGGEPFLCLSGETFLHRMGAFGTMLHNLCVLEQATFLHCAGRVHVGPCCTTCTIILCPLSL